MTEETMAQRLNREILEEQRLQRKQDEEPDSIRLWSMISSEIELEKRKAKEAVLQRAGISQEALDELKDLVIDELEKLQGKTIKNEYGEIRGQWSFIKDRDGNVERLSIDRCFIVPKESKTNSNSQQNKG